MHQILQTKFYTNSGHNNLEKTTKTCFLQVAMKKLKPLISVYDAIKNTNKNIRAMIPWALPY